MIVLILVLQEVEGDGERVEVEGIGVVDEEAVVDGFVHLEAHLDGGELCATCRNGFGSVAEVEHQSDAVHDVLL